VGNITMQLNGWMYRRVGCTSSHCSSDETMWYSPCDWTRHFQVIWNCQ